MFSRIVEIFSLIRGCRHNWPNHVKTSRAFYDDFFYLYVLEFILLFIKTSTVITQLRTIKNLDYSPIKRSLKIDFEISNTAIIGLGWNRVESS